MKVTFFSLILLCTVSYTMEKKELDASNIKLGQLQVNVWPVDGAEDSQAWQQIIALLDYYTKKKEKGEFSFNLLSETVKKLDELSINSKGTVWGDATTVFIPNSAKIDKTPLDNIDAIQAQIKNMSTAKLDELNEKLKNEEE